MPRSGEPVAPLSISVEEARALVLRTRRDRRSAAPDAAVHAVRDAGYIQIDTISRVARAHHHCLWNRVDEYAPGALDDALARRAVFEYWSHAAAYLPSASYRFCRPRMRAMREQYAEWRAEHRSLISRVKRRIRNEGPLMTRDFPDDRAEASSWWDWKPAKRALEHLFHVGELLIHERRGFQKVYALADDVLPSNTETRYPTEREMARYLVDLTLRNTPLSRGRYFSFQHRHGTGGLEKGIHEEVDAGTLCPVDVEGTGIWYCRPALFETSPPGSEPDWARILSPFDSLVIQRDWFEELFGFRYQIECYVPAAKRVYGYFSLPVVWNHGFAGLVDAKAERAARVLRVLSLHLSPDVAGSERFRSVFGRELDAFARFNGCDEVRFEPGAERFLGAAR